MYFKFKITFFLTRLIYERLHKKRSWITWEECSLRSLRTLTSLQISFILPLALWQKYCPFWTHTSVFLQTLTYYKQVTQLGLHFDKIIFRFSKTLFRLIWMKPAVTWYCYVISIMAQTFWCPLWLISLLTGWGLVIVLRAVFLWLFWGMFYMLHVW